MSVEYLFQAVLVMASVGLAFFCLILSRRLRRLNDLETGLGGAIAVMAAEVDRLEVAMRAARDDATEAGEALTQSITAARKERALWDLRQKIDRAAASPETTVVATRRLRKRVENAHA
ncbi:hypothetical protein [Paracoccus fistulariae]|uniref:Uncharacterized protein n=1 Tax=Paracoccus fistulariae TaxID=658446 RepID=A0ABY7SFX1_9RHOB|nr:hypothetical protein [Paracoccus fistulariae]MDB6182662.1 hypothetical protein [Paracoccus fistulariae]WCR05769.1 hypothetical protein JHX87_09460 [Paracoccus fistulariae]